MKLNKQNFKRQRRQPTRRNSPMKPKGVYVYGVWLKNQSRWGSNYGFRQEGKSLKHVCDVLAQSGIEAIVCRAYIAPPKGLK